MDLLLDKDFYRTTQEWGANPDLTGARASMILPALGLYVHHSVTVMTDENDANPTNDADDDMRRIERARPDLGGYPYSFAAHPSGIIAEGNGTHKGAHTAGFNSKYFGFVAIGNYDILDPTPIMLENMSRHIADLVNQGKMIKDFFIGGHREVKSTACPGANLYPRIHQIKTRALHLINNPTENKPSGPKPEQTLEEDDMGKAFRFPDGKVWLCSSTHREHINEQTLHERALVGLVAKVPSADPNKDSIHPLWVRKASGDAVRILSDLAVI